MLAIKNILKKLDFFKVSAQILYDQEEISSGFGGCISILIISICLLLALPFVLKFFSF